MLARGQLEKLQLKRWLGFQDMLIQTNKNKFRYAMLLSFVPGFVKCLRKRNAHSKWPLICWRRQEIDYSLWGRRGATQSEEGIKSIPRGFALCLDSGWWIRRFWTSTWNRSSTWTSEDQHCPNKCKSIQGWGSPFIKDCTLGHHSSGTSQSLLSYIIILGFHNHKS